MEHRYIQKEKHQVEMGEDRSDTFTNQRTPKRIASNHQKLGRRHRTASPLELPDRTNSAIAFILDFYPPKLGENTFLLF